MNPGISDVLRRCSTRRGLLIAFLFFLGLKLLMDLYVVPTVELKTGGYPAPDIDFSTSPETIETFITKSNGEGLEYYLKVFFAVDILFPLALCSFLALALNILARNLFLRWTTWERIALLPLTGMICDYIESIGIVILILRSEFSPMLANIIMVAFKVKWFFGLLSLLLVLVGATVLAARSLLRRRNQQ